MVLSIVGAAAAFLFGRDINQGSSAALQSGQAELANAISLARIHALANGDACRVLVHVDPTTPSQRFLRRIVVQEQRDGSWQNVSTISLPSGVYVLPGNFSSLPAGLFAMGEEGTWVRSDATSALRSTALRSSMITSETVDSEVAEQWVSIVLSGVGSTAQAGDLVLATGAMRPAGSFATGESPIELRNPDGVLGLTLSAYGATAFVHDRLSF